MKTTIIEYHKEKLKLEKAKKEVEEDNSDLIKLDVMFEAMKDFPAPGMLEETNNFDFPSECKK